MNRLLALVLCLPLSMLALAGCGGDAADSEAGSNASTAPSAPPLPESAIATDKPGDATPISQLKASAKEGDSVVIRAVIGGRVDPFVTDRAIMTVVDAGLEKSCGGPSDPCKTPWDYCCTAAEELKPHLATVQIVDASGAPLKADLTGAAFKPFDTVIVAGTVAARPDDQMLIINTESVYVEKASAE